VNPARSLGPALFAGGDPLAHVWLFILAPLVGAALAAVAVRFAGTPLVSEEAVRSADAPATVDRTGADLSADDSAIPAPTRSPEAQHRDRPRA
jgi:aquaporin Z